MFPHEAEYDHWLVKSNTVLERGSHSHGESQLRPRAPLSLKIVPEGLVIFVSLLSLRLSQMSSCGSLALGEVAVPTPHRCLLTVGNRPVAAKGLGCMSTPLCVTSCPCLQGGDSSQAAGSWEFSPQIALQGLCRELGVLPPDNTTGAHHGGGRCVISVSPVLRNFWWSKFHAFLQDLSQRFSAPPARRFPHASPPAVRYLPIRP